MRNAATSSDPFCRGPGTNSRLLHSILNPLNPGSSGAARLCLAHDGRSLNHDHIATASSSSVPLPFWSLAVFNDALSPTFEPLATSHATTSIQLTPLTLPSPSHTFTLHSKQGQHTHTSLDASIVSARRTLQQFYPDVDIPDWVLADAISDNAQQLDSTVAGLNPDLDGSYAIAHGSALALLGPVSASHSAEASSSDVFALLSVGGDNRDHLLVHQLHVAAAESLNHRSPPLSDRAREKQPQRPASIRFCPAFRSEATFATPILQITPSFDRRRVIVRTHSSTTVYQLQTRHGAAGLRSIWHRDHRDFLPNSEAGGSRHMHVCFCPLDSSRLAAIDSRGIIDLISLPIDRLHTYSTTRLEMEELQRERQRPCNREPWQISFGHNSSTLIVMSAASVFRLDLPPDSQLKAGPDFTDHGQSPADPQPRPAPRIHKLASAPFCLSYRRPGRFISMAMAHPASKLPLLAVSSSENIHWFDLCDRLDASSSIGDLPLFSCQHHRADDPSLMLFPLPPLDSQMQRQSVAMWALGSLRHRAVSVYSVRANTNATFDAVNKSSGQPIRTPSDKGTSVEPRPLAIKGLWDRDDFALDMAPLHFPTALPDSVLPGAAPLIFDSVDLLSHRDGTEVSTAGDTPPPSSQRWVQIAMSDRGGLFWQTLACYAKGAVAVLDNEQIHRQGIAVERCEPRLKTSLYKTDDSVELAGPYSAVATRVLPFAGLYKSVVSDRLNRSTSDDSFLHTDADIGRLADLLDGETSESLLNDLSSAASSTGLSSLATLKSMGQVVQSLLRQDEISKTASPVARNALVSDQVHADKRVRAALDAFRAKLESRFSTIDSSPWQCAWLDLPLPEDSKDENRSTEGRLQRRADVLKSSFVPKREAVSAWTKAERRALQHSLDHACAQTVFDADLESPVFVARKIRILDPGKSVPRRNDRFSRGRGGTNWTALDHKEAYGHTDDQDDDGPTIPPPQVGPVQFGFFEPLTMTDASATADVPADGSVAATATAASQQAASLALLPKVTATARVLLSEWQLGEDPTGYEYCDPYEGLHRLPRASRLSGPTVRARSRSFSRASSVVSGDLYGHARHRSRSGGRSKLKKQSSMTPAPPSSSQFLSASNAVAPPQLASKRQRRTQQEPSLSNYTPSQSQWSSRATTPHYPHHHYQQPQHPPQQLSRNQLVDVAPSSSPDPAHRHLDPAHHHAPGISTQIEPGRFGARPSSNFGHKPPPQISQTKKKKRAQGF
ncbi:hypothetical protein BCV70DRAFT_91796 [Testicularia cyperi]|uniref:RRN6 beta-propeller domain-containing protein n=1 Tax=Testicularia cyperi TaxID=1882483 RepID=A0A317XSH3_9BASI|nr:hypothetical protein BCV70DRAFT_91796 [Testicularia cyperi]